MPVCKHSPPGALRYPEAAQYLGISQITLERLVKRREIRCVRPTRGRGKGCQGVPVFFFRNDLDSYLNSTANKAP